MKQLGLIQAIGETHKADKMPLEKRLLLQRKRLTEHIEYVKENSPFFSELYSGISPESPLDAFPVTNKLMLMEHFDRWHTDPDVSLEKVREFMTDTDNVGRKLDGKYLVFSTSGSTGNPCIVLYDDNAMNVSSAIGITRSFSSGEVMKRFIKAGGKSAAVFADKGFYLGCGSIRYQLHRMPWKKRQMMIADVRYAPEKLNAVLNAFQPTMLGIYPTAAELLADEQLAGRLNIHPVLIMTGGEYLSDDVRKRLAEVFKCHVQTNYSCTEGGTMACECPEKHFHINDDWIIIEAVDENGKPVPFGTQSAKILLTNLANKICPIIRFEITDRVILHNDPCPCGNDRPWLEIEGRTDDILTFSNGVRIAPLSVYAILKEVHGMKRFQLVQKSGDVLELRIISENKESAFKEASAVLTKFLSEMGVNAEMILSENEPSANPKSGKFKHIICK